jgi:uncharacterized iron-regulated membrane protein
MIQEFSARNALYRTIWRWHFYAGLFVMPFILILSLTGAVFLFKPRIDRFEERSFRGLPTANTVSPNSQLDAALAAFPGAKFSSYRLPVDTGDAALIHLGLDGDTMRDVFVSPQGRVVGSLDPDWRIIELVRSIHGSLLLGKVGGWMVELAASWAIVMILSGLYLWWPSGGRLAGVVWPRLSLGKRAFWRDIHAVTGFWVSSFALVLLVSGLPWASVWGDAFKAARTELGLIQGKQDWKTGGEHAEHDHNAMMAMEAANIPLASLTMIVAKARAEALEFPVVIAPPGEKMAWSVKSNTQNRPNRVTITYDMATGAELDRQDFASRHVIDRAVGYGIAWHEGALLGWFNVAVGLFTAVALITLMVSGFIMWRRRRPEAVLGAPPLPHVPARIGGVVAILLLLAAVLPLLAASLILLWLVERLIFPSFPRISAWLGLASVRTAG